MRHSLWPAVLLLLTASTGARAVELELERVQLDGGVVEFYTHECIEDGVASPSLPVGATTDGRYTINLDLQRSGSGEWDEYFNYIFHVAGPAGFGRCFRVAGRPVGFFVDERVSVPFFLRDGGDVWTGEMSLVLHNNHAAPHFLKVEPLKRLNPASLTGKSTVWLSLANELDDVSLTIVEPVMVIADHPEFWVAPGPVPEVHVGDSSESRTIGGGKEPRHAIKINIQAKPLRALGASILPISPQGTHETLTAKICYSTLGGVSRMIETEVSIRFVPSFWALGGAVFLGALLGGVLLKWALQAAGRHVGWLRTLTTGVVLGVILQVAGMLLIVGDSQFRVLGFELDPFQILPAFLIGAFAGVAGPRGADSIVAFLSTLSRRRNGTFPGPGVREKKPAASQVAGQESTAASEDAPEEEQAG